MPSIAAAAITLPAASFAAEEAEVAALLVTATIAAAAILVEVDRYD